MNRGFIDKLVERIHFVEPDDIGYYLQLLSREKGFLEVIFNAILEGVIVTDPHDRIIYMNKAACLFFGVSGAEHIGIPLSKSIPGLDLNSVSSFGDVMSRDLEVFYPEHRFLNFYITPLMSDEKETSRRELVGRAVILRDITEERREKQQTIESERFSAVTLLAAGVAHEIGNPLNSLDIQLQLMERHLNKSCSEAENLEQIRKSVGIARGEVARLDQIISKFLKAVRPSPLESLPSDFNALILECVGFLKAEIEDREIIVELFPSKEIPLVSLDRNQIRQALYNVIRNSFQAVGTNGKIRVATGCDDTHVWVSIGDTGGGIDPKAADKIFQPYFTTKKDGNGLGLLVVQRIVRAHGGEIELRSAAGKGLLFTIRLPRDDRRVRFLPPISEHKESKDSQG
ncbi:MAG: ATP-binding protein [Verrucomicrobiota bacterium]